jgi:SsrA-binding protein
MQRYGYITYPCIAFFYTFFYYGADFFMTKSESQEKKERVIISNRKARHDYHIVESLEAGVVLRGTEVKSLRLGNANLQDSYAFVREGEVYLEGMHISPYEYGNQFNHDPRRERKLLLNRKEIRKLIGKTKEKGFTLIPLSVYFKNGKAKVELALARGKKSFDKRKAIADRDAKRDQEREVRHKMND